MRASASGVSESSVNSHEPPCEKKATRGLSTGRTVVLISALNATVTVGAINTGMITVLLPNMAEPLHMSRSFLLWYVHCRLFTSHLSANTYTLQACPHLLVSLNYDV